MVAVAPSKQSQKIIEFLKIKKKKFFGDFGLDHL
jgi:hypothetical protein